MTIFPLEAVPDALYAAVIIVIGSPLLMYEPLSRDAVDTASILIFETFRGNGQFGEAAAMAFILFGIILILSQIQNRVGEKLVFYG